MRNGWTQDEFGFTRVVADWLPLAVSERTDGQEEFWVGSIDSVMLTRGGQIERFKDQDLAMRAVEIAALERCELAAAELSGPGASAPGSDVVGRAATGAEMGVAR